MVYQTTDQRLLTFPPDHSEVLPPAEVVAPETLVPINIPSQATTQLVVDSELCGDLPDRWEVLGGRQFEDPFSRELQWRNRIQAVEDERFRGLLAFSLMVKQPAHLTLARHMTQNVWWSRETDKDGINVIRLQPIVFETYPR